MRILLTNACLKGRTGTEVVTMEAAAGLVRRGHDVVVFSRDLGPSAEALRRGGVRVTDRLDELTFDPDIVHGNHGIELVHGLIGFPDAPGVFVCHDPNHWISSAPDFSRVLAYVAVDRLGRERIAREIPRARDKIRIVHNAVDLERYRPRDPLPTRPIRALALTKQSAHLPTLEEACRKCGVEIDALGPGLGLEVDDLPERLKKYDLVFATARMALEAMAVGCAAIVVDARGLAGLVTPETVESWRDDNYGQRTLTRPVTVPALLAEISAYDASDASCVAENIRTHHALDRSLSVYETIYHEAIDSRVEISAAVTARELNRLMCSWAPLVDGIPPVSFGDVMGRIVALERGLAWRDNEIAARDKDIVARDHGLAWRDNEIAARDAEIAARDKILASRSALVRRLAHNVIRRWRR